LRVSTNRAKVPSKEIQIPEGELNEALIPIPFDDPTLLPAKTLTTREARTTWRTMWLLESEIRAKSPDGGRLTPFGK
jgi:hypothetical protein